MNSYHNQTIHTWESVRSGGGMDLSRQPDVFKVYPSSFPFVSLADLPDLHEFLHLSAGMTAKKVYPGGEYFLRANPSAGALYPCELYMQTRSVEGLEDGIYHYEPQARGLSLLHSLGDGGLEACMADKRRVDGLVLFVSAIYYRSSWKYRNRAFRYCLLDSGHLLGGVEAAAACLEYPFEIVCQLDREEIQQCFGFQGKELAIAMAVCGTRQAEKITTFDMELPFVNGSGGFKLNPTIEETHNQESPVSFCKPGQGKSDYPFARAVLRDAIVKRRSIRAFKKKVISTKEYQAVLDIALMGLNIDCGEEIKIFSVVNRVEGLEPGLYESFRGLRSGNFANMAGYLCLEQALGADSGVTVFLTGNSVNYLPLMLKAGIIGQRIYLSATALGFGCSGIGAFYDNKVAEFLETDDMILYALAFGR